MWLITEFEATTLFSLKPAMATASGGKTLLVPTPFAVKMALLDVACRLEGQDAAADVWEAWLAELPVALHPAPVVVVNNTFIKVLRPRRNPAAPGSQHEGYFQKTIAYREYAQLDGTLGIALGLGDAVDVERLARWVLNINYLGKRGSFVQVQHVPQIVEELPSGYLAVSGDVGEMALDALLTQLDDVGPGTSFAHVNIYASSKRLRLGKERLLHHVALPYRLVASSRGYSYYQLEEAGG